MIRPSSAAFAAFSTGLEFRTAIDAAGLPVRRVEPIGEVRTARLRSGFEA